MSTVKSASLCLLATTLIFLIVGGSMLTEAASNNLKAYTFYPGIGYYQNVTTPSSNWTQSHELCLASGGRLAVPNSEAEAEVYKDIIAGTDPAYQNIVFIGFHDLFVNGDYETVHDYPVVNSGYTRWALGAPNVSPTLRCGGFSKDGGLVNLNCAPGTSAMYICEQPLWADYEPVPDLGYYKFHIDAKTWPDAWQVCRQEGSHLAVINSFEEHQALQEILIKHPNVPESIDVLFSWVGVHANFAYNKFQTVLATTLDEAGYSTWESGYPAAGINALYTYVALARNNGTLIMRPTTYKLAFFCEHEL